MEDTEIQIIDQLEELEEVLLEGTRIPFTGCRIVEENESAEIIENIRELIPTDIIKAKQILSNRDSFIKTYRQKAEQIIQKANLQREEIVNTQTINNQISNKIEEEESKARIKCDQLINEAHVKAMRIEKEMDSKIYQLEMHYKKRLESYNNEEQNIRNKQIQYAKEIDIKVKQSHDIKVAKLNEQLEQIKEEGRQLRIAATTDAQRIRQEAIDMKITTKQKCDSLINKAKTEAHKLKVDSNKYVDETLKELETKILKINNIVVGGRNELSKITPIDKNQSYTRVNSLHNKITIKRAREKVNHLKNSIMGMKC